MAELVDIVVNGRTSRRGLLGTVALAVVSGCAAKLKVVGDEAMIGENYPGPSSPAVSSSKNEVLTKYAVDGELEVPLDALVMDCLLNQEDFGKIEEDEAKADAIVEKFCRI